MDVELIAPPVGKMANKRRTRKSSRNIRDIIVLNLLAECDGDWEGAEDRKKNFVLPFIGYWKRKRKG